MFFDKVYRSHLLVPEFSSRLHEIQQSHLSNCILVRNMTAVNLSSLFVLDGIGSIGVADEGIGHCIFSHKKRDDSPTD